MIETVTTRPPLAPDSVCAVRWLSAFDNYAAYPFAHFWEDGQGRYASLVDGTMIFVGDTVSEEWLTFMAMQPALSAVVADGAVGAQIAAALGRPFSSVEAMTAVGTIDGDHTPVAPKAAYELLSAVFADDVPPFDVWYADVSHRTRHAGCLFGGTMTDGRCVCTAMTTAYTQGGALIGAVATHPDYRRRGLAAAAVSGLAAVLQKQDKRVFICPKHAAARRVYENIGFTVCGSVITIK